MAVELPALLKLLIDDGRWATPGSGCDGRIELEVARRWDPHAAGIHLLAKPTLLSADLEAMPGLQELWNTRGVDPDRCLVIADFGIGSDNPIVLDFSHDPPSVRTQQWPRERRGSAMWVTVADSFDDFARELGLVP